MRDKKEKHDLNTSGQSYSHRREKKVWRPQCSRAGSCPWSHQKDVVTRFLSIAESCKVGGDMKL